MQESDESLFPFFDTEPEKFFEFDSSPQGEFYALALLENMQRRQFSLRDTGISSRVYSHWKKEGLIPEGEDGKWAYFNFIQYLWLHIIKDLRAFGLPLETLAVVKEELFKPQPFMEEELSEEDRLTLRQTIEEQAGRPLTDEQYEELIGMIQLNNFYQPTLLTWSIVNHFQHRTQTDFLIYVDGRVTIRSEHLNSTDEKTKHEPHIVIPLARYFADFISDDTKAQFLQELPMINQEETEVLQAMRSNNVKELTIKFIENGKETRIDLITKSDGEISADKVPQFAKLLATKQNMSFTMKTKAGQNLYYETEERRRIK